MNKIAVQKFSLNGELLETYESIAQASLKTRADHSSIWHCINNRRKTAGGFIWKKC